MANPFETTIFAGELRRRITIQRNAVTQDAMGGQVKDWVTVGNGPVWAKIEPLSGRELTDAAQIYPESDTRFTVRFSSIFGYTPGLDPSMRILDQYGNQYDITNISDVDDRHIKLDILAIQRPAGRDA